MAERTRCSFDQETVGEDPLPGYGPVVFVNRRMRTRMSFSRLRLCRITNEDSIDTVVWGLGEKSPRLPDWPRREYYSHL